MIPKAIIQAVAQEDGVLVTTVEKDYVLGWILYGIAQHPVLSQWVFKGGTCLKKCYFETYRFSEDLDFTVPYDVELTETSVRNGLDEVCHWISTESGIEFPADRLDVESYTNKQGTESLNAKLAFSGPLQMARRSLQRMKFDLTQNELLVDPPQKRSVFHRYEDRIEPAPQVACYSINEILSEKTRALYERQGRARDVYDIVNIYRAFREGIDPIRAKAILAEKFVFKKLPAPTVASIIARIDIDALKSAWAQQLSHQLTVLPSIETFASELNDALTWWMEPQIASPLLESAPLLPGSQVLGRDHFVGLRPTSTFLGDAQQLSGSLFDRIRFAARNRLCVEIRYDGITRLCEPYSLRYAEGTGNTHLFVFEILRGGQRTGQVKRYGVTKLEMASVTTQHFDPRWAIEL